MAKQSMIQRELKRQKMVEKYASVRMKYKKDSVNPNLSASEREEAMKKLHSLPRNSSKIRLRSRCKITGRPHSVYRKFNLCRNKLREYAMQGDLPGVRKSSW